MSPTTIALLGFASWTLLMLVSLGIFRVVMVSAKGRTPNSFNPSGDDMEGFGRRLTRVHANCYEFLPIAATIMLYAIATDQQSLTNPLAFALIGARIGQSVVHLISASNSFVLVRFGFFGVQIFILIIWLLKLFHHI